MFRIALPAIVIALACHGQDIPTFRSDTTLVEFTVAALDGNGKPVTDLKKDEISIVEQGQHRSVAFFRFEGQPVPGRLQALPPNIYSNRAEYTAGGPARNVTAILLDALNTPAADQSWMRDQALQYLQSVTPGTRVAIYWLGAELRVLHDLAAGSDSLTARLKESFEKLTPFVSPDVRVYDCLTFGFKSGEPCSAITVSPAETVAFQLLTQRRKDQTLAALSALGDQLAGIPGRKSLVWIGAGIPVVTYTGSLEIGNRHNGFKSFEAEIRKTAQRLATQGIAIYPVDAKGVLRGSIPPPVKPSPVNSLLSNYLPESANDILANLTGGRVVKWTNQLARGMEWADTDQRGSYSLGFYTAGDAASGWHNLSVKTTRRGVRLTYRQGYLPETASGQPAEWTENQWRAALANPIGSTAIHLDARFEALPCQIKHGLLLQIPAADLHFRQTGARATADLEVAIADRAPDGGFSFRVNTVAVERSGEIARFAHTWQLAPGTSTVRLIVRDRSTGRLGNLDIPVN